MANNIYTPGPWKCKKSNDGDSEWIYSETYGGVAVIPHNGSNKAEHQANAERIVACVNACADIEDPASEINTWPDRVKYYEEKIELLQRLLKQEQDDRIVFLAALERAAEMMRRTKTGGYRIAHDGEIAHEEGSTFLQVAEALDLAKYGRANAS